MKITSVQKLIARMLRRGISEREIAEQTGLTVATIYRLRDGKRKDAYYSTGKKIELLEEFTRKNKR